MKKLSLLLFAIAGSLVFAQAAFADTWITSGPSGTVASKRAKFAFAGPKKTKFTCRLDAGTYKACRSPKTYTGLSQGEHTFSLKNSGSTHVDTRTWTVDTVRPRPPAITSGPRGLVNSPRATFTFTGEAGATFSCKLGPRAGGFVACTSPKTYNGLADGAHVFQVRQRDAAGNLSKSASRTWTIDTTAPAAPTLTATIIGANASFTFSGEPGASFKCALDGAALAACTSPTSYTGLPDGAHTFRVRQYDTAGNESPAATHTWTIDTTPPPPTVESIAASCAGDVLHADATASGAIGSQFDLTLYQKTGSADYSSTGQSAIFSLTSTGATHYTHDFDVSTLTADSYKVVSSTGTESNIVLGSTCGPGGEIPEAPAALLLPLSLLGLLGIAAGALYVRRRSGGLR
jgi:hypothetical protein